MNNYRVIGLMSGSSLDGLDIAYCTFNFDTENKLWLFEITQAQTLSFTDEWVAILKNLSGSNAKFFCEQHAALGKYFGKMVNDFISLYSLQNKVDFIASHGHTIFHYPGKNFTTQIADAAALAAITGFSVVSDFRSLDVAHGGQGTPIVPIGDLHLFGYHELCLNLGGISNISSKIADSIIAFDICTVNQVLNQLASTLGLEYDNNGEIASRGRIEKSLLDELNSVAHFAAPYPKSLDNSFSKEVIMPIVNDYPIAIEDKLCTFTEHVALQISKHIEMIAVNEGITFAEDCTMLVTGGGAFNNFLMTRIRYHTMVTCHVPDEVLVKYKEALVIAFMGVLRMRGEVNVLKSVTGASRDTVGGSILKC